MTCILLYPRGCLGAEQLNLVLVDGGCGHMLVIERGSHIKYSLIETCHGLELPASGSVPRFNETVTTSSVQNGTIFIES